MERKDFSTKGPSELCGTRCGVHACKADSLVCAPSCWMEEKQEFKAILDHMVNLEQDWAV